MVPIPHQTSQRSVHDVRRRVINGQIVFRIGAGREDDGIKREDGAYQHPSNVEAEATKASFSFIFGAAQIMAPRLPKTMMGTRYPTG